MDTKGYFSKTLNWLLVIGAIFAIVLVLLFVPIRFSIAPQEVLLFLYRLAVWRFLATPGDLYAPIAATLPSFSGSLLTLLTISLAKYVGVQAADPTNLQVELPLTIQVAKTSVKWSIGEVQAPVDGVTWVLTAGGTSYRLKRHAEFKGRPHIDWRLNPGVKIYFQAPNDDLSVDKVITERGEVIIAKRSVD